MSTSTMATGPEPVGPLDDCPDYKALASRVLNSKDVDPISLVEEYIGKQMSRAYGKQLMLTGMPLLIGDLISLTISFWTGLGIASLIGMGSVPSDSFSIFFVMVVSLFIIFLTFGLYNGGGMHPVYEFRQTLIGTTMVFVLVALVLLAQSRTLAILTAFPFMLGLIPLVRSAVRNNLSRRSWWGVRCAVFDQDRRVGSLYRTHQKNLVNGFRPIGYIQNSLPDSLEGDLKSAYLGSCDDGIRKARELGAVCALVHRRGRPDHEIFRFVGEKLRCFSRIIIVPDDDRLPSLWSMGQNGGLCLEDRLLRPGSQLMKRTMDFVVSFFGLIALIPVFIGIAVWTKLTAPGPLFYGHERIGKHGRRFKAWKFRTMVVNADEVLKKTLAENPEMREEWESTYKLKNDPRITPPGRLLRRTSLDELPQLWNVLMGEMSLVGPRPIVVGEVERYRETFSSYLRTTPGVTGLWQVSGRNLTTYDRRVELDGYYVRNWSIWFDVYILCRTVKTVLYREGAF